MIVEVVTVDAWVSAIMSIGSTQVDTNVDIFVVDKIELTKWSIPKIQYWWLRYLNFLRVCNRAIALSPTWSCYFRSITGELHTKSMNSLFGLLLHN